MNSIAEQTFNVLFVDDDADEFYLFNEALEQAFLPVKMARAKDGRQLLHQLRSSTPPDIIFMDLNMPYKDGIETLAELKAVKEFENIPVIIFSTSSSATGINTCYEKGATYYAIKPETFDDITKLVKKVFAIDWRTAGLQPPREQFVLNY